MNTQKRAIAAVVALLAALLPVGGATAQIATPAPQRAGAVATRAQWDYQQVQVDHWDGRLKVEVTNASGALLDLYLRRGAPPTSTAFDAAARTRGVGNETLTLDAGSTPALSSGVWWIGVRRAYHISYSISVEVSAVASPQPGMGADPHAGGTSFRVWAPNATAAYLAGSFNNWSGTATPMASEGNGNWSLDIRNLAAGAEYKYVLTTPNGVLWKNDPRARQLTHSLGNTVTVDPQAFAWNQGSYSTPAWNEMVIYEMHLGTFRDVPGNAVGTLDTARLKLPYLQSLGINVVELMPLAEFPGDYSWGYNGGHPFAVEEAYGGAEALRRFVRDAHALGIAGTAGRRLEPLGPE